MSTLDLPLRGFTFLEVGRGAAVAYAGKLLAVLGADVITAEPFLSYARQSDSQRGGSAGKGYLGLHPVETLRGLRVAGALDSSGALISAPYPVVHVPEFDVVTGWARSGAMWLTGHRNAPPRVPTADVAGAMRGAAAALELLTRIWGQPIVVSGDCLLGERAAILGSQRQGRTSVGGSCRLLPSADGWLAVNLPRHDDWTLVVPWLARHGAAPSEPPGWELIRRTVRSSDSVTLSASARELGLPVSALYDGSYVNPEITESQAFRSPFTVNGCQTQLNPIAISYELDGVPESHITAQRASSATVVDLSSLWAGPLATDLIRRAGAEIIKVEGATRPDGTRRGHRGFFDLLNGGKQSLTVDFDDPDEVGRLHTLLRQADVVVEASRPRALEKTRSGPADHFGTANPRQIWLTLTGYGRTGQSRNWVAFGDEAAVAAGLVAWDQRNKPVFCADAVADPATGLHASLAIMACLLSSRPYRIDISMKGVAESILSGCRVACSDPVRVYAYENDWFVETSHGEIPVARPSARLPEYTGPDLGSHNDYFRDNVGHGATEKRQ